MNVTHRTVSCIKVCRRVRQWLHKFLMEVLGGLLSEAELSKSSSSSTLVFGPKVADSCEKSH